MIVLIILLSIMLLTLLLVMWWYHVWLPNHFRKVYLEEIKKEDKQDGYNK